MWRGRWRGGWLVFGQVFVEVPVGRVWVEIGEERCVALVPLDLDYISALDRVYVLFGGRIDVVFMFAGALSAIAVEGLWAHPPTFELDHPIWYAGGVKGGSEAGSEGMPCIERCDGGAVEVGQRHA